jgi:hypothetical protein
MPNNHPKFGIPGIVAASDGRGCIARGSLPRAGTAGGAAICAPEGLHVEHSGARIHAPHPLVGEPLDFQAVAGEEVGHGGGGLGRSNAGKDHLPLGRLQWECGQCGRVLGHLDHVNPVWQGRVQPFPDIGYGTGPREREFQVFGLARGSGRGRASVGNLWVRRETGGIGDGQPCPANSPFNSTRDIPVTGETHPASFRVPDNHALSHSGHARRSGRHKSVRFR